MQVTLKRRAIGKPDLFEQAQIFAGTATWNESCQILQLFFSFPCRRRWFIFTKHLITIYFQLLFTAIWFYCFNIDVLKNFTKFHRKTQVWESLFSKPWPATFLTRDFDTDVFLSILWNFQEHHFYTTPRAFCFCIYGTYDKT